MTKEQINPLSWTLVAVFTVVTLVWRLVPDALPPLVSMMLVMLLPFVFVFVHGLVNYRFRDVLVFAAITHSFGVKPTCFQPLDISVRLGSTSSPSVPVVEWGPLGTRHSFT